MNEVVSDMANIKFIMHIVLKSPLLQDVQRAKEH